MLLTISTTHQPATDLGYLLHKHPGRVQSFPSSFSTIHVFYPEVSAERCTAALMLEIDPIALIREKGGAGQFALAQYVNDRPYVASSFLSVAIAQVYGSALNGHSKERPELCQQDIPLEAMISAIPARGGADLLRALFEPLGYAVTVEAALLDVTFPDWGESQYYRLTLRGTCRLSTLLSHLYVLIPVMDDEKHYWVDKVEIEKLLRRGEGWLAQHPQRTLITKRYLRHQRHLERAALTLLDDGPDPDAAEAEADEPTAEAPISLNSQRMQAVLSALEASGAKRVLDLGCAQGNLIRKMLKIPQFTEIVGLDVSPRMLDMAAKQLGLDELPHSQRERVKLLHGSLTYRDSRLAGYDAAAIVEVIEHFDPERLAAFERVVFEFAHPQTVILTTPNVEYNVKYETLEVDHFRHLDHRFEWTRAEFRGWAERVAARYGYALTLVGIGDEDSAVGAPTQMGIFSAQRRMEGSV